VAARLTDRQKKRIIADYISGESKRAIARKYNISDTTVARIVNGNNEILQKVAQKKESNTADMIAYMESKVGKVKEAINLYMDILTDPEKLKECSASQIATVMGIVIDKYVTNPQKAESDRRKDEIEMLKLEAQIKDAGADHAQDNFIDALNSTASQVWEDDDTSKD
jgi:transposase-like protein